jgi:hypothetical protein
MFGLRKPTIVQQIMLVDEQLVTAGERLIRYRLSGPASSITVQRGVVDRMLDQRLDLMRQRDAEAKAGVAP